MEHLQKVVERMHRDTEVVGMDCMAPEVEGMMDTEVVGLEQ